MNKTVTFNERQAIQEYIDYLKKDNDRITEMYRESRERNMLEYKEAIQRLRVLDDIDRKLEKEEVPAPVVQEAIPSVEQGMTLAQAIGQYNKEKEVESKTNGTVFEYNRQEEEKRERTYRANKKSQRLDHKQLGREVAAFLKERGIPTQAKVIIQELEDKGYQINNPGDIMRSIRMNEPKVEVVSRGYYQYKF